MKRIGLSILVLSLACGNTAPDTAGAGPDAGTETSYDGPRCGLDFKWLAPSTMGRVLESDDDIDPLHELEATALGIFLNGAGYTTHRISRYETQLHRMRYQTQDKGKSVDATGYVIVPNVETEEEFPVILMLHGTTGLNDLCAPSLFLDDPDSPNYALAAFLSLIASYGYIVVAPDYIGLKARGKPSKSLHPYLVGEATAVASLDSVRAANRIIEKDETKAKPGRIAVWGASQGGHAAAFTVRYAPTYAPEMDIAAAVYAIPPLDFATHAQQAIFSLYSATGNIVLAFASMADWYEVEGGLSAVFLHPYDEEIPSALKESCRPTDLNHITDTRDLFTTRIIEANLEPALGGDEQWNCIMRENSLTTSSVPRENNVPGLVIHGEYDSLVEVETERAAFEELCEQGENLAYLECAEAEHTAAFFYSVDNALDFIDARLGGEPMPEGSCAITPPQRCKNQPYIK